jgi:uncharacterized protein DUF932
MALVSSDADGKTEPPTMQTLALSTIAPLNGSVPAARTATTIVRSTGAVYACQRPTGNGPLALAADMPHAWRTVDLSFDEGAALLLDTDTRDGSDDAEEIPVTSLENWTVVPVNGTWLGLTPKTGHRGPLVLRRSALSDLCARYKAGPGVTAFLRDRMPASIQVGALVAMMREEPAGAGAMLRVRRGEITSIVSERYAPFGAARMVDATRAALARSGYLDRVRVRGVASGMVHALRLSLPTVSKEIKKGDVSEVQLDFRNSDFGDAAFGVKAGAYRKVCENGLCLYEVTGKTAFNHSGKVSRLENAVAEAIPATVAKASGLLDVWAKSADVFVESLWEEIEALQDLDMTEAERKAVAVSVEASTGVKALPEKREPVSVYDLVNGMTDAAKSAATPERRLDLETIAGRVLAKPRAA